MLNMEGDADDDESLGVCVCRAIAIDKEVID